MRTGLVRFVMLGLLVAAGIFLVGVAPAYAVEDGIIYTPKETWQLEEEINGFNYSGNFEYFYNYQPGDVLTVTKNGVTTDYICEMDEDVGEPVFKDSAGNGLGGPLNFSDDQMSIPWEVGNTYEITLTYDGMTTTIPVEIIPNKVLSISYQPKDPSRFTIYQYTQGIYLKDDDNVEFWRYSLPGYVDGDTLTVERADGTAVYKFNLNGDYELSTWEKQNGPASAPDEIDLFDYAYGDEREPGRLPVGKNDEAFKLKYHNRIATYPVTIMEYESLSQAKAAAQKSLDEEFQRMHDEYYDGCTTAAWKLITSFYETGKKEIEEADDYFNVGKAYCDATHFGMFDVEFDYGREDEKAAQTVTVASSSITKTFGDKAFTLGARTNGDGVLQYSSNNQNVVTVNATGTVTIKGAGTAAITVYAKASDKYEQSASKKVTITVNKAAQKVTKLAPLKKTFKAAKKTRKLSAKKSFTLKATAQGPGKVTFTKANKAGGSKIIISKAGKVTLKKGLKKGKYKVKVTATKAATANYKQAGKSATIKITVK